MKPESEDPNPKAQGTHMGSCQNYGPFLGTLNNRCRIKIGTQKGTIVLTTTHVGSFLRDLQGYGTCSRKGSKGLL